MKMRFPAFDLEDKVKVWVGGNARNHEKPPLLMQEETKGNLLMTRRRAVM